MFRLLSRLGPGLLYAGAAIGVSHVVQSSTAGAKFGFAMILVILLAHLFKYPFFAVGPRYANLSGKSLIQGYAGLSKASLYLILLLTLLTMFTIQAAVTVVTAGLAERMTGIDLKAWQWSAILLVICALILGIGRYKLLDGLMKVIMLILAISTIMATIFSFGLDRPMVDKPIFDFSDPAHIAFLVAFAGWMPAPLDISIWHSIWTKAKMRVQGGHDLKTENFDFKTGFYGTAFLAICFVILGTNTLYGTGIELQVTASGFADQLIDIYTSSLGSWSYTIILVAAFTTMFSTTLTCFDAIPRVMEGLAQELDWRGPWLKRNLWMFILGVGAVLLLALFISNMKQMVTMATVLSFLTTPVIAYLSYRLVRSSEFKDKMWNRSEQVLAFVGLSILTLFSVYYLISLL